MPDGHEIVYARGPEQLFEDKAEKLALKYNRAKSVMLYEMKQPNTLFELDNGLLLSAEGMTSMIEFSPLTEVILKETAHPWYWMIKKANKSDTQALQLQVRVIGAK